MEPRKDIPFYMTTPALITPSQLVVLFERAEFGYIRCVGARCTFCNKSHNLIISGWDLAAYSVPMFWRCDWSDCHNQTRITKETLRSPYYTHPDYGPLGTVIQIAEQLYQKEHKNNEHNEQKSEEVLLGKGQGLA